MRLRLVPRERVTRFLGLRVAVTAIVISAAMGALLFHLAGAPPIDAFVVLFTEPFGSEFGISETLLTATPLLLCGLAVAMAYRVGLWNIGAEGQLYVGALAAAGVALHVDVPSFLCLPLVVVVGAFAGAIWAAVPAALKTHGRVNEVLSTLMLNYVAIAMVELMVYGPWKGPDLFPYTEYIAESWQLPTLLGRAHAGLVVAVVLAALLFWVLRYTTFGYEVRILGASPESARYAGIPAVSRSIAVMAVAGGLAGLAGAFEISGVVHRLQASISPGYGYTAIIIAFLAPGQSSGRGRGRGGLCRHGGRRGGYSDRLSHGFLGLGVGAAGAGSRQCPRRRRAGPLSRDQRAEPGGGVMADPAVVEIVLATAVAGGTPILLAGLGELVAERSGVLNLGVEGMMVVGAWAGFAFAHATGSAWLGVAAAIAAGSAFALLHAIPVVYLRVNQVVSGLALVILGTGLASLFGRPLVGQEAASFSDLAVPGLSEIPGLGPVFFSHDALVYVTFAMVPIVWFFLAHTRVGWALQVCGENPRLADSVGVRVALVRVGATVFGGAMAGLGGAYLSLAETPSWVDGLVSGRGWIALAMVLFAGWLPWRLVIGAWLFGGLVAVQFRAQAFGLDVNVYFLKMLPYLATLIVLALAARTRWHKWGAPAALGKPYAREERS